MSEAEELLAFHLKASRIGGWHREFKFLADRKFRFDFAWPEERLAVEIEGGVWIKGAHSTGAGIDRDIEKGNLAVLEGWRLLRVTPGMVKSGVAIGMINTALGLRRAA